MDRATHNLKDASLVKTKALSNGAGNVACDGLDLGALSARGGRFEACELKIDAPALTTTQLPDAETMTYSIESDDDSEFGSAKIVADGVIVQTGAAGAGAALAAARFKIPSDGERYWRVRATKTGTGDCSGLSMTVSLLF
ncbi:MAG TPA: hypothetical protein VMW52_11640 [Phycisphaerae bacterium]|nr:hypothetical protein [Phycisphaerae bacterium]